MPRAWRKVLGAGVRGAGLALYLCLVGIVPEFEARTMIDGVLALGETFVLGTMLVIGYIGARHMSGRPIQTIAAGTWPGASPGVAQPAPV